MAAANNHRDLRACLEHDDTSLDDLVIHVLRKRAEPLQPAARFNLDSSSSMKRSASSARVARKRNRVFCLC